MGRGPGPARASLLGSDDPAGLQAGGLRTPRGGPRRTREPLERPRLPASAGRLPPPLATAVRRRAARRGGRPRERKPHRRRGDRRRAGGSGGRRDRRSRRALAAVLRSLESSLAPSPGGRRDDARAVWAGLGGGRDAGRTERGRSDPGRAVHSRRAALLDPRPSRPGVPTTRRGHRLPQALLRRVGGDRPLRRGGDRIPRLDLRPEELPCGVRGPRSGVPSRHGTDPLLLDDATRPREPRDLRLGEGRADPAEVPRLRGETRRPGRRGDDEPGRVHRDGPAGRGSPCRRVADRRRGRQRDPDPLARGAPGGLQRDRHLHSRRRPDAARGNRAGHQRCTDPGGSPRRPGRSPRGGGRDDSVGVPTSPRLPRAA